MRDPPVSLTVFYDWRLRLSHLNVVYTIHYFDPASWVQHNSDSLYHFTEFIVPSWMHLLHTSTQASRHHSHMFARSVVVCLEKTVSFCAFSVPAVSSLFPSVSSLFPPCLLCFLCVFSVSSVSSLLPLCPSPLHITSHARSRSHSRYYHHSEAHSGHILCACSVNTLVYALRPYPFQTIHTREPLFVFLFSSLSPAYHRLWSNHILFCASTIL